MEADEQNEAGFKQPWDQQREQQNMPLPLANCSRKGEKEAALRKEPEHAIRDLDEDQSGKRNSP